MEKNVKIDNARYICKNCGLEGWIDVRAYYTRGEVKTDVPEGGIEKLWEEININEHTGREEVLEEWGCCSCGCEE
jgi:hypothetical protein